MKRNLLRLLSAFLCAVMVFCLMPWGAVSAAENAAPARKAAKHPSGMPVQQRTIQSDGEYHYFTTFADLQTLAGKSYSDVAYAVYDGTDMLTISQDLYLPEMLVLVVPGSLKVNSGVEFYATYLFADELVVDGTITTAYAEIYTTLRVNGTYYNYYQLQLYGDGYLVGGPNIIHMDGAYGYFWYYPENMAKLKIAANAANNSTSDSWIYSISFPSDMTITEDVNLPWNCNVYIEDVNVTVAEGVTLTQSGYVWMYGGLTVNGILINDGALDIYYDYGGYLTVNGDCSGVGYIYVTGSLSDPFDATPGLTGYTSKYDADYSCWVLTPGADIPGEDIPGEDINQLGTPTDLGWGYDYEAGETLAGSISWKNGIPDSGEFEIQVYRDGEPYADYLWTCTAEDTPQWHSISNFSRSDPSTGEYYFTVTALDNCGEYTNSPAAMSEKWYYVQPEAALDVCTNLSMDENGMYWELPADQTYVGGYEVVLLYAADSADDLFFADYAIVYDDANGFESIDYKLTEEGYYSFEVRLLSSDINQACNGQRAVLSEPFYFDGNSGNGDNNTGDDELGGDDNTGDDVQLPFDAYEWEVLKIANEERLAQGLNPLTMYDLIQQATDIRAVEVDQVFSHTRPDGTSCFTVFDEVGLSYWAAGENIAWGQRTPAEVMNSWMNSSGHRANILSASFSHMGVGFYNYSWVQLFTDGGKYTSIEVLVDDGYAVEPGTTIDEMDLIAVLDSTVYGTCYLPVADAYCSGYDPNQTGTQTVTISVLGVSTTFEVTVGGARMNGDYDSNGVVDDADVAYLLWHTLFADSYPIDISGDLNGDGAVDDADVAYLLWHTLFPDAYPL